MREGLNWGQKRLAQEAGVHHHSIIRLEKQTVESDEATIRRVLAALKVSRVRVEHYLEQLKWIDLLLALDEKERSEVLGAAEDLRLRTIERSGVFADGISAGAGGPSAQVRKVRTR